MPRMFTVTLLIVSVVLTPLAKAELEENIQVAEAESILNKSKKLEKTDKAFEESSTNTDLGNQANTRTALNERMSTECDEMPISPADLQSLITIEDRLQSENRSDCLPPVWWHKGQYFIGSKEYIKAIEEFQKLKEFLSRNTNYYPIDEVIKVALELGRSYLHLKEHQAAISQFLEVKRLLTEAKTSDLRLVGIEFELGKAYYGQRAFEKARDHFAEARNRLEAASSEPNQMDLADVDTWLGLSKWRLGEALTAIQIWERVEAVLLRAAPEYFVLADNWERMGNAYFSLGQYSEAKNYFSKSLQLHEAMDGSIANVDSLNDIARLSSALGAVDYKIGNYSFAEFHFRHSYTLAKTLNHFDPVQLSATLHGLGEIARELEQFERAINFYEEALLMLQNNTISSSGRSLKANILNGIAQVYIEQLKFDDAQKVFDEALSSLGSMTFDKATRYEIQIGKARLAKKRQRDKEALKLLNETYNSQKSSLPKQHGDLAVTQKQLGIEWAKQGNYSAAYQYLTEANPNLSQSLGQNSPVTKEGMQALQIVQQLKMKPENATGNEFEKQSPLPPQLVWNVWATTAATAHNSNDTDDTPIGISYLQPNTEYSLNIELSTLFRHATQEGILTAEATKSKRSPWMSVKKAASLRIIPIADTGLIELPVQQLKPIFIQLSRPAFLSGSLGSIPLPIRTLEKSGTASLTLMIWDEWEPIDEVSVSLCIRARVPKPDDCQGHKIVSHAFLPVSELAEGQKTKDAPDATLYLVNAEGNVHVVFWQKEVPAQVDHYYHWALNLFPSEVMQRLRKFDGIVYQSDQYVIEEGKNLRAWLFQDSEAVKRLEALYKRTSSRETGGTIYIRVLGPTLGPKYVLPVAFLQFNDSKGSKDFLGFHILPVSSLARPDLRQSSTCIAQWLFAVPRPNEGDTTVLTATQRALAFMSQWVDSTPPAMRYGTFQELTKLLEEGELPAPSILTILAHHSSGGAIHYKATDAGFDPFRIKAHFKAPSLAIIDACGSGSADASSLFKQLSLAGIDAVIGSTSTVPPELAGDFLNCVSEKVGEKATDGTYTLGDAHLRVLQCLRDKTWKNARYDWRALVFVLIGNSNLQVCQPVLPVKKEHAH